MHEIMKLMLNFALNIVGVIPIEITTDAYFTSSDFSILTRYKFYITELRACETCASKRIIKNITYYFIYCISDNIMAMHKLIIMYMY